MPFVAEEMVTQKHEAAEADDGASAEGIRVLGDVTSLESKGASLELCSQR